MVFLYTKYTINILKSQQNPPHLLSRLPNLKFLSPSSRTSQTLENLKMNFSNESEKTPVPDASFLICASPTDLMHPQDSQNPQKWPLDDLIRLHAHSNTKNSTQIK